MSKLLIVNEELPRDLRAAIDRDARERNVTLGDACTRILSERFGLEWEPTGARYRKLVKTFKLYVSEELHRAIRVEAAYQQYTVRGVALSVLAESYGVKPIEPTRRRRG